MTQTTHRTLAVIDTGRYWAGIAASAGVAVLVAIVGVLILERIAGLGLVPRPALFRSDLANYILVAILLAALAGLVGYGLTKAAPRPGVFFGWIMALLLVAGAAWPFAWTGHLSTALATGGLNLAIGIAVWSLVAVTLSRTTSRRPAMP